MKNKQILKILHISESYGWSGGANQAQTLAKELNKKGHINYIACPENGDLYKKAKENSIETFNFNPKTKSAILDGFKISKLIDEIKFDVIHAHHPKAHNAAVVAKFLSRHKPVLVVSRRVSHSLPKNILAKLKYKTSLVDAYIAVCEYVKNILVNYGIDEKKIYVIYSGVDRKKFFKKEKDMEFKKELGINYDEFVITLIGNFSYDKGQHILIDALDILRKKGYRFKVIFAGKNTDSDELKRMFQKKLPIEWGVFLGLRDDVEKILNITDINVNAAIKGEALSGSLREAMALGVPSVASDIAGNREILKDGFNGFLYNPGNYISLATKLEILINNTELRNIFSNNATKTIDEKFSIDTMVEKTLDVYMKYVGEVRGENR
jgi:glycosyltransferase involved in cell wall biosynthesis